MVTKVEPMENIRTAEVEPIAVIVPATPCAQDGQSGISANCVANGQVYRVVEGLPDKTADAMGAISDRAAARAMAAIRERQRIERLLRRNGIR
jgi:hypothetical protein